MGEIGKLRGLVPSALLQSPRRLDEARRVFVDVLGRIMVLKAGKPGTDSCCGALAGPHRNEHYLSVQLLRKFTIIIGDPSAK